MEHEEKMFQSHSRKDSTFVLSSNSLIYKYEKMAVRKQRLRNQLFSALTDDPY